MVLSFHLLLTTLLDNWKYFLFNHSWGGCRAWPLDDLVLINLIITVDEFGVEDLFVHCETVRIFVWLRLIIHFLFFGIALDRCTLFG